MRNGGRGCPESPATADAEARGRERQKARGAQPPPRPPRADTGHRQAHGPPQHRGPGAGQRAPDAGRPAGRPHTHKGRGAEPGGSHATDARAARPAAPPARAHLGPSRRAPGGHGGQPPAPARPRCRGARAWLRAADAEAHSGARADARKGRTPTAPPPRRPGGAQRAGRGGGEPRSGREATEGSDGPEAEVAVRPALRTVPGAPPVASLRSRRFRSPTRPAASLPARGRRREVPRDRRGQVQMQASAGRAGKRG